MEDLDIPDHLAVLLSGRPGSGKDTQGKLLAEKRDFSHIISSDLLKAESYWSDAASFKISMRKMRQGILLPDNDVVRVWEKWLNSQEVKPRRLILNGANRSLGQDDRIRNFLRSEGYRVIAVHVEVPHEICVRRIQLRAEKARLEGKPVRADDLKPEKRLKEYDERSAPVIERYRAQPQEYNFGQISGVYSEQIVLDSFEKVVAMLVSQHRNPPKSKGRSVFALL